MTAVAALIHNNEVYMGADSAGVCSDFSLTVRKDEKVFMVGEFLFGIMSSFRMGNLLRYKLPQFDLDNCKNIDEVVFMNTVFVDSVRDVFKDGGYIKSNGGRETSGDFLVGYRGAIYHISNDLQVGIPYNNYDATGCGRDLCLGSLHTTENYDIDPEERIVLALSAAQEFSGGVREPFYILKG